MENEITQNPQTADLKSLEAMIKEYIMGNLSIDVESRFGLITVRVFIEGEEIAQSSTDKY